MPRYFFNVKDGHRLFDASGFVCEDDTDAIIRATVLAMGVSLDKPEDDPERRIAIINDADERSATCPYAGNSSNSLRSAAGVNSASSVIVGDRFDHHCRPRAVVREGSLGHRASRPAPYTR
jgi:hypothetical protein